MLQHRYTTNAGAYICSVSSYYENIPESWAVVSLGTIGKITSGGTPKTSISEYYSGNIPWITPADMGRQQTELFFIHSAKNITDEGLQNSSAQLIEKGSIVYSSRAPIGHINIVPYDYTTNQGCKSITPYEVNTKWLYYALKSATPNIEKRASGTTFKEISAMKFSETMLNFPPLVEQERIVSRVEQLTQKVSLLS